MARIALTAWLLMSALLLGNDGSAEATPAGGIQLKREARISMEKERLTIGDKVVVEYEFLNTTDQDITTEVAFPVPGYVLGSRFSPSLHGDLEDWHVWVEGKELKYQTEVKAVVNGVDQAALLRRLSIEITSFGHFDQQADGKITDDIQKLSKPEQEELTRAGLFESGIVPAWTVLKTYHWQQRFSAHKILHMKHQYTPEVGLEHLDLDNLQGKTEEPFARLSDACVDPDLRKTLITAVPNDNGFGGGGFINPVWVDYILTTANTWKTPIKDFELVIEKPKPQPHVQHYVSLCWDGKVEKRADTFVAKAKNFVPKRELRVMFFRVGN